MMRKSPEEAAVPAARIWGERREGEHVGVRWGFYGAYYPAKLKSCVDGGAGRLERSGLEQPSWMRRHETRPEDVQYHAAAAGTKAAPEADASIPIARKALGKANAHVDEHARANASPHFAMVGDEHPADDAKSHRRRHQLSPQRVGSLYRLPMTMSFHA